LAGGRIRPPANFAAFFSILLKIKQERVQINAAKNVAWKNRKRVIQQYLIGEKQMYYEASTAGSG
jgi:hypothetical protein